MCLASVLFAGRLRARATLAVLIVAVAGFAYFATASPSARERVTDYSAADSTGRADLWDVAWRMTSDHPLQGVGLDNFITVAPDYLQRNLDIRRSDLFLRPQPTEVHNTYLNVLAELGFPGLLIFTALLAGAFGIAVRATRTLARVGDVEGELLARGFVIGASGMLTAYVFFSAQFEKQLWLILGGLIALSTVARAARRQAASE